jgi:serine/threonine-protein kinase RsbW/stage II sporulation protein AB (anti-sigma F factor)
VHRLAPHHPTPIASLTDRGQTAAELHVDLELTAVAEQVSVARRAVGELAAAAGLDDDVRAGVALAISEACSNVVVHAYVGADPGELRVRAEAGHGRLSVTVRDRGRGMCPRSDSPGIGLGLPLMASLCSTLEVRERQGGGTEICMVFESAAAHAGADWARTG